MTKKLFAALITLLLTALASAEKLPFDERWELSGNDTTVGDFLGRAALRMSTGRAIRRDVRFQDGTIELDLATTGHRSFFYVQFRMQSDGEHEEFYFRPHKSGLPDAIQYTPVLRGEGNWQLYHGEGATAAAEIPDNEWVHIKIVVRGSRAAVFVGDVSEPQLIVPRLAREARVGYVALRSFLPAGMPDGLYPTSFADLVVRPNEIDFDFPSEARESTRPQGVVSEWLVSEPFVASEGPMMELPPLDGQRWQTVETEPSGLALLLRHVERPDRGRATLLAKLTMSSEREQRISMQLGYSDEVTVFLNGAPILYADDRYQFDRPRREGLIGFDQLTVFLPLRSGDNEVVLAVTDVFGGWGVMGKVDSSGVRVSAR
ncbi:MAG TPA: hypothetical protein VLK65_32250 [Vicinamibacteria bacterium]|nr:hypothetical protein [Vicinamibacteria bacterium]